MLVHYFYNCYGDQPALPSFPTRRSSDLSSAARFCGSTRPTRSGSAETSVQTEEHEVPRIRALPLRQQSLYAVAVSNIDRKSTRLNSSHPSISYAVFCLKKKKH